jgi:hypothetical protein
MREKYRYLNEMEIAFQDITLVVEAMWQWGSNAVDPAGGFMPEAFAARAKEALIKYRIARDNHARVLYEKRSVNSGAIDPVSSRQEQELIRHKMMNQYFIWSEKDDI